MLNISMAQVHKSVTHEAEVGDIFLLPYETRAEVTRVRDLELQVEYLLEESSGCRYSVLVDKPEVEFNNSERDRLECGGEIYQGVC